MWIETVNSDPYKNIDIAIGAGLPIPDVRFTRKMDDDEKNSILSSGLWDVVGDTGIIIEHIDGPECTFSAYYDGDSLSCRVVSIHDPYLLTGGQGPNIGDNLCTVFSGTSRQIEPVIDRLLATVLKNDPNYRGFINVSVVWRGAPYYQYISYGASYKFIVGLLRLYGVDFNTFASKEFNRGPIMGFGVTMRLWIYPYDRENNKKAVIEEVDHDDESVIVSWRGDNIWKAWNGLYKNIGHIENAGICWRIDGDVKARQVFNDLRRLHYVEKVKTENGNRDNNSDNIAVRVGNGDGVLSAASDNTDSKKVGNTIQDSIPELSDNIAV